MKQQTSNFTLKFDPTKGDLTKVKFVFVGDMVANYRYRYVPSENSGIPPFKDSGNNHDSIPDEYPLPGPAAEHHGAYIRLKVAFTDFKDPIRTEYAVRVEVYQVDNPDPLEPVPEVPVDPKAGAGLVSFRIKLVDKTRT